jgi:hypothetical protein
MTDLQFVTPDNSEATWNVLLYGPGGNGKTVGACSAPKPLVLVNADGPDASRKTHAIYGDGIREVPFVGAKTLDDTYLYLTSKEGADVKTLVLDPLGEIYEKLFEELGGDRKDGLKNHMDVQTKIRRFVRSVCDLPINVVIVCHEEVADNEGDPLRRPLTGGKKLPEKIIGMVSIVGYVGVIPADEEKGTPRRWVAQLVEARGRRAKDRSEGLGDSRDINLEEWFPVATEAMHGGQQQLGVEATAKAEEKAEEEKPKETSAKAGKKEEESK